MAGPSMLLGFATLILLLDPGAGLPARVTRPPGGQESNCVLQGACPSFSLDPLVQEEMGGALSICIVTAEVSGPVTNGGIGTAYSTLAEKLARRGHKVTLLFTMGPVAMTGTFDQWVETYRLQKGGVNLVALPAAPIQVLHLPKRLTESWQVLRYLTQEAAHFDVIHFHDYQGAGYFSLLAKRQGLALSDTVTVVGCHGPTLWAKQAGNQEPISKVEDLETSYMERKSVELADYVVSPSQFMLQWMQSEGWAVNLNSFVQPNLLPDVMTKTEASHSSSPTASHPPTDASTPLQPPAQPYSPTSTPASTPPAVVATLLSDTLAQQAAVGKGSSPDSTTKAHAEPQASTTSMPFGSPSATTDRPGGPRSRVQVWELVFFARLETRKGLITFCNAIDMLLGVGTSSGQVPLVKVAQSSSVQPGEEAPAGPEAGAPAEGEGAVLSRVVFLGRPAMVNGMLGIQYVQDRARAWAHRGLPWKSITRMVAAEALAFLAAPGRLAVMPSRVENSPYTIYECAELSVPFVAADVGGSRDLIWPDDRSEALFEPTTEALVARLLHALKSGVVPARPLVNSTENEMAWIAWHSRIVTEHRLRATKPRLTSSHPQQLSSPSLVQTGSGGAGFASQHLGRKVESVAIPSLINGGDEGGTFGREGGSGAGVRHERAGGVTRNARKEGGSGKEDGGRRRRRDTVKEEGMQLPLVSVVLTHYERPDLCRQALASLAAQDYPSPQMEVVLVDDASTSEEARRFLDEVEGPLLIRGWRLLRLSTNHFVGGARNAGAVTARGDYILFMDDDNFAKPHQVSTLVTAALSSGAHVLTSFIAFCWGQAEPEPLTVADFTAEATVWADRGSGNEEEGGAPPSRSEGAGGLSRDLNESGHSAGASTARGASSDSGLGLFSSPDYEAFFFLGGSWEVGAFKNCFGDGAAFIAREAFEALGGWVEGGTGSGYEDWELYARAALQGFQVDVVPEVLYWYRYTRGSVQRHMDWFHSRHLALSPYLVHTGEEEAKAFTDIVFPVAPDGLMRPPTGLASEGGSRFHNFATPRGESPPA